MKALKLMLAVATGVALSISLATADDGQRLVRSVSSSPGVTENPEPEGEHAFIKLMNFHVPSQAANGELVPIEYYNIDDVLVKTEEKAKPLINVYVYGPVITFPEDKSTSGYPGHGRRDAFGAVSLDDGETWKATNLSNSADQSSFVVSTPLQDPGVSVGIGNIEVDTTDQVLTKATWNATRNGGKLNVTGDAGDGRAKVEIRNAVTQEKIFTVSTDKDGDFDGSRRLKEEPCMVQAGIGGDFGPAMDVEGATEECIGGGVTLITDYPGDVRNVFHAVAGNKVLVAWHSKFCRGGSPVFGDTFDRDTVAGYLGIENTKDLYLTDMFGVGGSQGSTNYNELEAAPVGEVPHGCLWSARGVLREDPEEAGATELVWFQAERMTSGRRDVNRVETACVAGGGCAITWQEDPEGLRPGGGEGPGTGWSGATTASKTDIWYSFIKWEDFDIFDLDGTPTALANNILATGRPQPYVPMMAAARLTNNDRCQTDVADEEVDYCGLLALDYGIKNQCIDEISIPLGSAGELQPVCVADTDGDGDGDLPNVANTAASRPRLGLQPRDSDGDGVTDDAWVIVIHEEDKGLGKFGFPNDVAWNGALNDIGVPCGDPDADKEDGCIEGDVGKNEWYISFAMGTPQTSVSEDGFGLVDNLVAQHNQYNAPEVNWITGTYYPPMSTADMWDFGVYNYLIFNNEIARRASLMSQSVAKAEASENRLLAMPLFKEGIMNQGGPADIMARRVVLPCEEDDDEGCLEIDESSANPYDFANMVCEWYDGEGGVTTGRMLFEAGDNPYYPKGLCGAPAINISGRTPLTCEITGTSDGICPGAADMTCDDDGDFGQLCLSTTDPEDSQLLDKQLSWYECPGSNGVMIGGTGAVMPACYSDSEPDSQLLQANLDDRSWYNPMDVAKAHRGFLDGDLVAMIYAWSPNWKANSEGKDHYELYVRRSFDGGLTWTTTPGSFVASDGETYSGDGTTTCETWRDGADSNTDSHVCTVYTAGEAEQSRNLTQHKSLKITTLDPRYTPTIAGMPTFDDEEVPPLDWAIFEPIDPTDYRNPSRFFIVYESGDNTTVAVGEAEPLNLDYSRAENFGDHFTVWAETDTKDEDGTSIGTIDNCYPNDPHGDDDVSWATGTGFCNEFDTLEGFQDSLSEEASITASANGDFLYGVWGQFNVDKDTGEFIDGDSMFRRVWYLDDYISETAWTLPGTQAE